MRTTKSILTALTIIFTHCIPSVAYSTGESGLKIMEKPAILHLDVVISDNLKSYENINIIIDPHETTLSTDGTLGEVSGVFCKYKEKKYFLMRHPEFPINFGGISSVTVNQISEQDSRNLVNDGDATVSLKYLGKGILKINNTAKAN